MKKVILAAMVSAGLVSGAFANASCSAFNGAYVGGGLTYSNSKIKNKTSVTFTSGASSSSNLGGSTNGVGFNGFLGYGALFGSGFYLGGELGLGYDGSSRNTKTADGLLRFKAGSKFVANIAARLGYAFSNVLPYVKVGFEGRSKATLQTAGGQTITTWGGQTFGAHRNGFILGLGLDVAMTKNVFLRGEYVHNFGTKNTYSFNNVKLLDWRTSSDTFLIGAGYKF